MWRAFFLALGAVTFIVGAECTLVDKVFLSGGPKAVEQQPPTVPVSNTNYNNNPWLSAEMPAGPPTETPQLDVPGGKAYTPPDWAPWSLMSAGAVIMLYSFTVPKRMNG
jgi:hypothetical protein